MPRSSRPLAPCGGGRGDRWLRAAAVAAVPASGSDYWAAPELRVAHQPADWTGHTLSEDTLDGAFPDLNCDRAEGGRWRQMRSELHHRVDSGWWTNTPESMYDWRGAQKTIEQRFNVSQWLQPTVGRKWVYGGPAIWELATNTSAKLACPLGMAAIVLTSVLVQLAEAHAAIARGESFRAQDLGMRFEWAAITVHALIKRALKGPRMLIPMLAATRWPILDMLAAAERHLVGPIYRAIVPLAHREEGCFAHKDEFWQHNGDVARRIAERTVGTPGDVQHPFGRRDDISVEMQEIAIQSKTSVTFRLLDQDACRPLLYINWLITGTGCIMMGNVNTGTGDPDFCIRQVDRLMQDTLFHNNFLGEVLFLDFEKFPVFGLWLNIRNVLVHRLELPFASTKELGSALGLDVQARPSLPPVPKLEGRGEFRSALAAVDAFVANGRKDSTAVRPTAIVTMCWGKAHAYRLGLWLRVLARVGIAHMTLVMCFDYKALDSCREAHPLPEQCAMARDWPRTSLSKIASMLLLLSRDIDVFWLDTDTVVLKDPMQFLEPTDGGSGAPPWQMDMLFSIGADSWNCINSGAFFVRATHLSRRHFSFWLSVLLERPFSTDQATLSLLLGLVPMGYVSFAQYEGLLTANSPRARALGTLRTPVWGSLDRARFPVTGEVLSGGIEQGRVADVVIFHLLDSWPEEWIPKPIYQDLRARNVELTTTFLEVALQNMSMVVEWLERSESGWFKRRDCRRSYDAGR